MRLGLLMGGDSRKRRGIWEKAPHRLLQQQATAWRLFGIGLAEVEEAMETFVEGSRMTVEKERVNIVSFRIY